MGLSFQRVGVLGDLTKAQRPRTGEGSHFDTQSGGREHTGNGMSFLKPESLSAVL